MLSFDRLHVLEKHLRRLHSIVPKQQFFVVGGAIRDLLLWITDDPKDIDFTTAATPDQLRQSLPEKASFSRFRTEKFWTITLLPKEHSSPETSYEITPFRSEWNYEDFRHPTDIERSMNLLSDSKRRDFTINCLYVTIFPAIDISPLLPTEHQQWQNTEDLSTSVNYFPHANVLLLHDEQSIEAMFSENADTEQALHTIVARATVLVPNHREHVLPKPKKKPLIIVCDPHFWVHDLLNKKLRAVWEPSRRFSEDALRILRGVRFVNTLNQQLVADSEEAYFDFDNATRNAMKKHYYLVSYLAKERIHQEVMKVFSANNPFGYIGLLDELNLIGILFPALHRTKNVIQPVRYHTFDVFNHTLLTLFELQKTNPDPLVKLAMLYHDVGKTDQYYFYSQWISKEEKKLPISWHMYHTFIGVELAAQDFWSLSFSKKEVEEICRYIKYHHRPGELLDGNPENLQKKLRKLVSEVDLQRAANLIDMAIADRQWQYNPVQPPAVDQLMKLKEILFSLYTKEGRFTMKQLAVNGNDLMKTLGIAPGPDVGTLLEAAFERVLEDVTSRNTKEHIFTYLNEYRNRK